MKVKGPSVKFFYRFDALTTFIMKSFLAALILFLLTSLGVKAQNGTQQTSAQVFSIPSYQWDYDLLLPDTAVFAYQNGRFVDSARRAISSSKQDSNKVWQYILRAQSNVFTNPDSTVVYA